MLKQGRTALHSAVIKQDQEILNYLLSLKPNMNVKHYFDKTPLHVAAKSGNLEAIRALLKAGADVDGDSHGTEMTPLSS